MPEIIVSEPMGNVIDRRQFAAGMTFADAVMSTWPTAFPDNQVRVYGPDGERLSDTEAVLHFMQEGEQYRIVLYPNGPTILGVQLGMWILAGISLAASVLLAPKIPKLGNYGNYEWEAEARPQFLSGQTNQIRPGDRVPEVFGIMRVYPDIITRSVIEYFGNYQSIRELFVVTNGYAQCSEFRLQENDLGDLPAYSVDQYLPGEDNWPVDFPIIQENDYLGQVDLPAPNERNITTVDWTLNASGFTVPVDNFFNSFSNQTGDIFYIYSTKFNSANRKIYTVTGVSNNGRTLNVTPAPSVNQTVNSPEVLFRKVTSVWGGAANPGSFTPSGWQQQWSPTNSKLQGDVATNQISTSLYNWLGGSTAKALRLSNGKEYIVKRVSAYYPLPGLPNNIPGRWLFSSKNDPTPPAGVPYAFVRMEDPVPPFDPDVPNTGFNSPIFVCPGENTTQLWLDFEFPQGLYYQTSGQAPVERTVTVEVNYRIAGTTFNWTKRNFSFTDKTRSPRRWTRKITGLLPRQYEVYISRVNNTVLETSTVFVQDSVRWIGLKGVQETPNLENLPIQYTLLELGFFTQNLSQALTNRRFNCLTSRFLPNHLTGDGSQLVETRKIADAILYTAIDLEQYDKSNIDTTGLGDIQTYLDGLDAGSHMGEFNGIIDQAMTTEDQIVTIANAGRIMTYRKARNLFFKRPQTGELPVTLFNSRNKTQPEQKTMMFGEANDPDAVIIRFLNEETEFEEDEIQYPNDIVAFRPKTITMLGITKPIVAYRRAKYEYDLAVYQKDSVVIPATEEGILLAPGDVFANSDVLLGTRPIEGEIRAINGTTFTFDKEIPAGSYVGRIRDQYGSLLHQSDVTIAADGREQDIPSWTGATMPGNFSTVGLLYEFVGLGSDQSDLYIVTNIDPDMDGSVSITGLRYADEIYSSDTTPLPDPLVNL